MVQRIGGMRRKSRHKFRRKLAERGKLSLTKYFQKFEVGDKVVLKGDSIVQKSLYHPRFHSRMGVIKGKKGRCYEVEITDQGKKKTIVTLPIHLGGLKDVKA